MRRLAQARGAHRFGNARDDVVEQGFQRLRRDISRTEPGTPRRHDQIRVRCSQPLTDLMLNVFHVVSDHRATDHIGGNASERLADLFAALVDALPARALGADRQDAGAKAHPSSLEAPTWPSPSSGGRDKLAVSLRRGNGAGPPWGGSSPSP